MHGHVRALEPGMNTRRRIEATQNSAEQRKITNFLFLVVLDAGLGWASLNLAEFH